jgi:hypothetical protein
MDGIAITILGCNLLPVYYFYVARTSLVYGSYKTQRKEWIGPNYCLT